MKIFEGIVTPPSPPQPAETRARTLAWAVASNIVSERRDYYAMPPIEGLKCSEPVIALGSPTTTEPNLTEKC